MKILNVQYLICLLRRVLISHSFEYESFVLYDTRNIRSKSSTIIEPCTECVINEDCGDWDVNHMKCEKSKCICGQNWLIGKNRRCNKLNRIGIQKSIHTDVHIKAHSVIPEKSSERRQCI